MGFLFWNQEMQYILPTPIPAHYQPKVVAEHISLPATFKLVNPGPVYFHFFNPDCPCSRFNLKHFRSLTNQFHSTLKIYAIIPTYVDVEHAREMIDDNRVIILQDTDDQLANACGVYSTPQAVILDTSHKLYFRGNYNRTRYCTAKESNYAEIALTAFAKGETPPPMDAFAEQSYGCQLPSESDQFLNF